MNRFITYLICKKLNLKKNEYFQFANQKNKKVKYYIETNGIMKLLPNGKTFVSDVPFNYLISNECKIVRCE